MMIKPLFRAFGSNAPLSFITAVFATLSFAVISLRIIDHGLAFGRWVAQHVR